MVILSQVIFKFGVSVESSETPLDLPLAHDETAKNSDKLST